MKVFIRATGSISPQHSFGHPAFLAHATTHKGNRLRSVEPEYKTIIDPKWIRRMSRIIRMGVAAAMECLREADITLPGAIITGTALGCLEDTGVFLSKMVEQNEDMLTPTSFIQSTHNTVGAQIALMLSCHHYNNTYVHRGFSFESALLDAMLYLQEGEATNVLAGSVDEITDISHAILSRFGLYKATLDSNLNLFNTGTRGTIAGEGAAFFLLSTIPDELNYAVLDGMHTFYKPPDQPAVEKEIGDFLAARQCTMDDIDLIITGRNGDPASDLVFDRLDHSLFHGKEQTNFKQLCGEYPTATSFACWLAANILKSGGLPPALVTENRERRSYKKLLVYNHSNRIHHSLLLLSAC